MSSSPKQKWRSAIKRMNELAMRYLDRVRTIVRSGGPSLLASRLIRKIQLFIQKEPYRMLILRGYFLRNWIEYKGNKELLRKYRIGPRHHSAPMPLISVIIPTFNRARILCDRTIPSVLRQTYHNFELIIVGDHCTDNTQELIDKFHDKRIRFLNLEKRGEYPRNPYHRWMVAGTVPVNKGLEIAKGEWIAHLDDDDEFSDDHLEVLLEIAMENNHELVYGIIEMEVELGKWEHVGSYPPRHSQICRLSALYESKLKFFKYDVNCWKYEEPADWNLWRRMKEAGVKIGFVDNVVGKHYLEGAGLRV